MAHILFHIFLYGIFAVIEPYSYEFLVNGVSVSNDILQFYKSYDAYYLLTNTGYYKISRKKYEYSFHRVDNFTIRDKKIIRKYFGADFQNIVSAIGQL